MTDQKKSKEVTPIINALKAKHQRQVDKECVAGILLDTLNSLKPYGHIEGVDGLVDNLKARLLNI